MAFDISGISHGRQEEALLHLGKKDHTVLVYMSSKLLFQVGMETPATFLSCSSYNKLTKKKGVF